MSKWKFYYIMHMRSNPTLQLVEFGFLSRCEELGLKCEMAGPQDRDVEQTVAIGEQVLAKGDATVVGFWATAQAYYPSVTKISEAGVPVVIPHFAIKEGTFGANVYKVLANPVQLAEGAAKAMCEGLGDRAGTVARTLGSFNETENLQQETFAAAMAKLCPKVKILPPEEEGFDAPKAIAKAVSLIQANPDIIGAFTSTGGGPGTWANAQVESGKQLVVVGPDYTRANLDWIKQGKVYALMAQPLYEEGGKMVDLMVRAAKGEVLPYWTVLPGPIVTPKEVDRYYKMLDDVEKLMASGQ
jgi:ribose transport system substrate-binding protein